MRKSSSFWCVLVCLLAGGAEMLVSASEADICQPIGAIYANGQELCENMWDGAFVYETNEDAAYTMWFFDETSPNENDAITAALGNGPADTCDLQYLHKQGAPTAEGSDFTECHPWKENACCYEATVTTHDALNEAYGEEYEWDRCGKLSQACERVFVQEACFYECEVNAGLYRAYTDEQWTLCDPYSYDPTVGGVGAVVTLSTAPNTATPLGYAAGGTAYYGRGPIVDNGDGTWTYTCSGVENRWQMAGMPIKASYCDAWYTACFEVRHAPVLPTTPSYLATDGSPRPLAHHPTPPRPSG